MEKTAVIQKLVNKTLEGIQKLGYSLIWVSNNAFELRHNGKLVFHKVVNDYHYDAMFEVTQEVCNIVYGSNKREILLVEGCESDDCKKSSNKDIKHIANIILVFSTSDDDFYADVQEEDFDETICFDEQVPCMVFAKKKRLAVA